MEQTTEQVSAEQAQIPQSRDELTRPVAGRMVAGVAQGLANRFRLPPWLVRIGFIVTAFAGGLGVALYAAGWALVRSEDEPDTPAERFFAGDRTASAWIGIGLVFVAGLILLGSFSFFSGKVLLAIGLLAAGVLLYTGHITLPSGPAPTDPDDPEGPIGNDQVTDHKEGVQQMSNTQIIDKTDAPAGDSPAGGLTPPPPRATPTPTPPDLPPPAPRERSFLGRLTIGVMLLSLGVLAILDSIEGIDIDADPRHYMALAVTILGVGLLVGSVVGRARWLIVVGVVLIPTLVFSPAFEYDWSSQEFDVFVAPDTFAEIDPIYSIDAGNLVIDLTDLDWDGETVDLGAYADIGNIEIRVPGDIALRGEARTDIGRVAGPEGASFGLGEPTVVLDRPGEGGLLVLDVEVNVGNVDVVNR